jgi:hypothetical protein
VWVQHGPELVGTGAIGSAEQGTSLTISGDGGTVAIGGPVDNNGAGAAWIFSQQALFAGAPGKPNCQGHSVAALARQYGGLNAAAAALGFTGADALQNAIMGFCDG